MLVLCWIVNPLSIGAWHKSSVACAADPGVVALFWRYCLLLIAAMRPVSGRQWQMRSREKKWKTKTDILKTIWLDASLRCVCGSGGQRWSRWCLIIGPLSTSGDQLDKTLFLFYYYYSFKASRFNILFKRERTVSIWRIRSHSVSSGRKPWQHLLFVWHMTCTNVFCMFFFFSNTAISLIPEVRTPYFKTHFSDSIFFPSCFRVFHTSCVKRAYVIQLQRSTLNFSAHVPVLTSVFPAVTGEQLVSLSLSEQRAPQTYHLQG